MERLLVTRIDSTIAANLALALADRCEVYGLYEQAALESPGIHTAPWPTTDTADLETLVDQWQPRWILHCGPLSPASWDAEPDLETARGEPRLVARLAELAQRTAARLTVLSSDAIFTGPRLFHDESSPPAAGSMRAQLMRSVERAAEDREALVVRTHAYGWSFAGEPGFAERLFDALESRTVCRLDGCRHATPILASDLAELLWRSYETRLSGLYHIAGAERTSPHRFAAELAAELGAAPPRAAVDSGTNGQDETSLSSKRARRMLAAATPTLREGLQRFVAQAHSGWRERWHRAESLAHAA